jgi:hypothetical protein
MQAVELREIGDRIIVDIDRSAVDFELLFGFLENLKVDSLAKMIDFDDGVLALANEIKSSWWEANKDRFIKPVK